MIKKQIKIILILILLLVIGFETTYIIRTNIMKSSGISKPEPVVTATPEPLPVVGGEHMPQPTPVPEIESTKKIIVIDPGHGKPSSLMSDEEKREEGWVQNNRGEWGEWRHYKIGSPDTDCEGVGCNKRATGSNTCWYPIGSTDRNTEPDINLKNAEATKKYLERMGYEVRLTRDDNNENPSIKKRLSFCYPDNDRKKEPDAELYICLHSNASGGISRGTSYIKTDGIYDQKWISSDYAQHSNELGKLCNDYIAENTSLDLNGNGEITWKADLIVFFKSPVPCAYLEIGFFDNLSDLEILKAESDKIGEAIAKGVDEFCKTH